MFLMVFRSEVKGICATQSFHTKLGKTVLQRPCFVHGGVNKLKQDKAVPNLLPQSLKHTVVKNDI